MVGMLDVRLRVVRLAISQEERVLPNLAGSEPLAVLESFDGSHEISAPPIPQDANVHAVVELVPGHFPSLRAKHIVFRDTFRFLLYDKPWTIAFNQPIGSRLRGAASGSGELYITVVKDRVDGSAIIVGEIEAALRKMWDQIPNGFAGEVMGDLQIDNNAGDRVTFAHVEVMASIMAIDTSSNGTTNVGNSTNLDEELNEVNTVGSNITTSQGNRGRPITQV